MKNIALPLVLSIAVGATVAPAQAADRIRAGEWALILGEGERDNGMKRCITASQASVVNGDDKTFGEFLGKGEPEAGCTIKNVRVSGNQVSIDSVCKGEQTTNITTYHGDWYEQVNSDGTKVRAVRVGDCP
jgi:hypothetical protein